MFNEPLLKKAFAIIFVAALLLAFVRIVMLVKNGKPKQPSDFQAGIANLPQLPGEVTVDNTEDSRGIGYSGQRKIAYDKKGNVYVAYRKKYGKRYEVFVSRISRQTDSSVTGFAMPIADVQAASQRVPSIAVDSKGTIHAVWYGSDTAGQDADRQIKYVRSNDQGKTWTSWRNISYVSGFSSKEIQWQEHPSLLVGHDDALYVVWEGKDAQNGNQQIKFSRSDNGGNSWSSWKNAEPSQTNTQSRPSLIEDPKGDLYLFAYSSEGNGFGDLQQVQYAVSTDKGGTWSPWQVVSDPLIDSRHASATIGPNGVIHIAWRGGLSNGSGPSQVFYRSFRNGQWGSIISVAASSSYQFFPSIGTDDAGNVFVAWMENNDPSAFPKEDPQSGQGYVSFMRSGVFQPPVFLGQNGGFYPNVPLQIDGAKQLPVAFLEQSGTEFSLKVKFLEVPK